MQEVNTHLKFIIAACQNGNKEGQRKLYTLFYSYGLSVCLRYANNMEEAQEILNDGFLKTLVKINQYDSAYSFKQWFRVILIHAAIDYHRKYDRLKQPLEDWNGLQEAAYNPALDHLVYNDVIKVIQQLPPAYRTVFNLHAIEGLKHYEIAEKLGISIGASKSNLSKARRILQGLLSKREQLKMY